MEFKEVRNISVNDVRKVCVMHNLYTEGTNEEYTRMFSKVTSSDNFPPEDILKIAEDIVEHSELSELQELAEGWDISSPIIGRRFYIGAVASLLYREMTIQLVITQ